MDSKFLQSPLPGTGLKLPSDVLTPIDKRPFGGGSFNISKIQVEMASIDLKEMKKRTAKSFTKIAGGY